MTEGREKKNKTKFEKKVGQHTERIENKHFLGSIKKHKQYCVYVCMYVCKYACMYAYI
jgi:hypothetical protein